MPEISEQLKLIVEYGFVTIFLSGTSILLYKYFSNKIAPAKKSADVGKGDLRDHSFFQKIDFALQFKIPHLELGCKARSKLFQDMLAQKFIAWKTITTALLEKDEIFLCDSELLNANTKAIAAVVKEYELRWKQLGVPKIAIQKFAKWHNERVKYIMENVKDIVNSTYYDTQKEKMAAILCSYSFMVDVTIVDAERTLRVLNGELVGKEYQGLKIIK